MEEPSHPDYIEQDTDKLMTDVKPVPVLSVLDDYEMIAEKDNPLTGEEITDLQVFHWDIERWSDLDHRVNSPSFEAGGHTWDVLLFPKGNNQNEFVSLYVDLTHAKSHPDDSVCAQFVVCISRPSDPTHYVTSSAQHRFVPEESDWGFTRCISLDPKKPDGLYALLEDDRVRITVILRVVKDTTGILWHNFINYDSKKVTGYVGLQNQGATCYMNSLFQSLYFTNSFRKAVYQIPTEHDEPTKSIALALQRVFFNLQHMNTAVGTTELTKSFGWDSFEAFRQHDVQEFNRVLQDNLEIKMKNTPADGAIKNLFVGRMKSYIKCINVNFESSRSEDYYDIQLNVKGCKNLEDSFKDYITEETLEGENKYMAEGHGLQDAKKGVIFESFPPVLHLQLKRFEYDMMRDMMVKINDRHEFPTEIDLEPYLSENADKSQGHKYILHGVLVHSGDLTGGHYFAFVKPEKTGPWFKFDDDRVIPATLKEVLEENYGGEMTGVIRPPMNKPMNRFTNAYMLVYIRECMLDQILAPLTDQDIPRHLIERTESETRQRELERKEKEQQHLYMRVMIATDETFRANRRFDFASFDEKNNELIVARLRKDLTMAQLKEDISKDIGLPKNQFRLWLMVNRQNRTIRIDSPIPDEEDQSGLDEIRKRHTTNQTVLRLYLEKYRPEYGQPAFPPYQMSNPYALIFIKLYLPETQTIQGLGPMYIHKDAKVSSILDDLRRMAGFELDQDILLYEEIRPAMIEVVDTHNTFNQAEIQDGDILIVQRTVSAEESEYLISRDEHPTADSYLNYEVGKISVWFAPVHPTVHEEDDDEDESESEEEEEFELMLHKDMGYEQISERVAKELGVDSDKLRLINPYVTGKVPLKRFAGLKLGKILPQTAYHRAKFLYEKLDVSLEEMESKCMVTVVLCTPTLKDEVPVEVLMPKDSYMLKDLMTELAKKGATFKTVSGTREVRFFDEIHGKFNVEYNDEIWRDRVSAFNALKIYAEEIPEEEMMKTDHDMYVSVFHFQRTTSHTHSVPFLFLLRENEPWPETKKRLQSRTGLDDKEWSKVRVNIVSRDESLVAPVTDEEDALTRNIQQGDMIGLDHMDKTARMDRHGNGAIFIRG
ncbi:hypothetical protein BDB01DRAFT_799109 [Pilobolus umbonatus]|nr:hypothetical protein BDB01DRAFT_799109 [Pilobolus umbonatus]